MSFIISRKEIPNGMGISPGDEFTIISRSISKILCVEVVNDTPYIVYLEDDEVLEESQTFFYADDGFSSFPVEDQPFPHVDAEYVGEYETSLPNNRFYIFKRNPQG